MISSKLTVDILPRLSWSLKNYCFKSMQSLRHVSSSNMLKKFCNLFVCDSRSTSLVEVLAVDAWASPESRIKENICRLCTDETWSVKKRNEDYLIILNFGLLQKQKGHLQRHRALRECNEFPYTSRCQ